VPRGCGTQWESAAGGKRTGVDVSERGTEGFCQHGCARRARGCWIVKVSGSCSALRARPVRQRNAGSWRVAQDRNGERLWRQQESSGSHRERRAMESSGRGVSTTVVLGSDAASEGRGVSESSVYELSPLRVCAVFVDEPF